MYNSCVLMARQFLTPRGSVWHTQAGLAALDWDSKEKPKIWGKHHDDRGGSGISLDWEVNALLASSVYAKTAFFFLLFSFLFLFSHRVEVERGGGGGKRDAALLVALWFVTWANVCLLWEVRPGHIPEVPSWSAALEGSPTWPAMTLMPLFTLWLCVPLHIAHVSYSICRRVRLKSPEVHLGLQAEEKAGPRCEPEAYLQLCCNCLCALFITLTPKSVPFTALCLLLYLPQHFRFT